MRNLEFICVSLMMYERYGRPSLIRTAAKLWCVCEAQLLFVVIGMVERPVAAPSLRYRHLDQDEFAETTTILAIN